MQAVSVSEMFDFIKWMNEFFPPDHPVERCRNQKRFVPQIPLPEDEEPTWVKTERLNPFCPKFYTIDQIWTEYCKSSPLKSTWKVTFFKVVNKGKLLPDYENFVAAKTLGDVIKKLEKINSSIKILPGNYLLLQSDSHPVITVEEMPF